MVPLKLMWWCSLCIWLINIYFFIYLKLISFQAYDFVFSVDVEDGKPPLKLPYNRGEDPYVAATRFLAKNNLPSDYLEQVWTELQTIL